MLINKKQAKRIGFGDVFKPVKVNTTKKLKGGVSVETDTVNPQLAVLTFHPDFNLGPYENIDKWIELMIRTNPDEVKGLIELVKAERALQLNKFAATKDMSLRRLLVLPSEVTLAIKKHYPWILKDGNALNKLARTYPGFSLAEKI